VKLPDGTPAENATVFYSAMGDQCGLDGRQLLTYAPAEYKQMTGKEGRFSFTARPHGMELMVIHHEGWANQTVDQGSDGLELRLQPWATVTGRLVDGTGEPVAGVPLTITLPDPRQNGRPFLILKTQLDTDAHGRFAFPDVPPCRFEIQRIVPQQPGSWRYLLQTWSIARPGMTNDLGDVIYDKPPPSPALETIKRRLGL
jgi:hypothetical protein